MAAQPDNHDADIDELVDGLLVRGGSARGARRRTADPATAPVVRHRNSKGAIITGAVCLVVGVIAGIAPDKRPDPSEQPIRTVTVTETRTQEANGGRLPPPCARAMRIVERMMVANEAIGSAGEHQLDLSHAAYRAMFTKDWATLNRIMQKQTDLNNSLDKPSAEVLGVVEDLKKAIEECRDAAPR